jgi:hypothetical protein
MEDKSLELKFCTNCGSTEYLENYPTQGTSICAECLHEITAIPLNVIQEESEETFYACPSCGKKNETKEAWFDDDNMIFKCKGCNKLYGYRILESTFEDNERLEDNDFNPKAVAIAKTEGQLIYLANAYKKEKNSIVNLKQFELIVHEKSKIMRTKGVSSETIKLATEKASNFKAHEGPLTEKQLKCLFSASIVLAQGNLLGLGEFKGTRLTERQIAEIFEVDRKTIRKWGKILGTGPVKV